MKKLIIILIVLIPLSVMSQDYFFTQNSNSMTLSPSFTGINKGGRANISVRNALGLNLYQTYL